MRFIIPLVVVFLFGCNITGEATADLDSFAQCLTEKGATMYGSRFCSHCSDQKDMFGDSFQYIDYVECSEDKQACAEAGIRAYPSWVIDGDVVVGKQPLHKLAGLSMCSLSAP